MIPLQTYALALPSNAKPRQLINVEIKPDFTASGIWEYPTDDRGSGGVFIPATDTMGGTASIQYKIMGIRNESGPRPYEQAVGGVVTNTGYNSNDGFQSLYIDYGIRTPFISPLALYEFMVFDDGTSGAPRVTVSYPSTWSIITTFPENPTTTPGALALEYPVDHFGSWPAVTVFAPNAAQSEALGMLRTTGKYTVAGSKSDVSRLVNILSHMDYADDLMKRMFGSAAPEKVVVYSTDMTYAAVGYEADALALKPNVIVINKDMLLVKSDQEIETTLIHEIAHLVNFKKEIIRSADAQERWFTEGMAVCAENQARPYIYKKDADALKADLLGRSRLYSAKEASGRINASFSKILEDGREDVYGTGDLYTAGGLILCNFLKKTNGTGIKDLLEKTKMIQANSYLCASCTTKKILQAMATIAGTETDTLAYPFKGAADIEGKLTALGLVGADRYKPEHLDDLVRFMQSDVKDYFGGKEAVLAPAVVESTPVASITPRPAATSMLQKPEDGKKQEGESAPGRLPISTKNVVVVKPEKQMIATSTGTTTPTTPTSESSKKKSFWARLKFWK